jgi:hypothetical protein
MHGAKPWWLPQRGKPKLRYSGKAARVRLLTGQLEDNDPLFTGSTPDYSMLLKPKEGMAKKRIDGKT